jgi:hypothetical protein
MTLLCKNECGTPIKFDNNRIGPKGRKIPLNKDDGTPHQCLKRPSLTIPCRHCSQPITFDEKIKANSGKMIPLNLDRFNHNCPKSPYNLSKRDADNKDS